MAGRYGGDTGEFRLDSALTRLADDGYGSNWSITKKKKTLIKFGRNTTLALGVRSTLWDVGPANEVYLTAAQGNLITVLSSTSASDAGKVIYIEGHRFVDGQLVFVSQRVTCTGTSRVTLPIPMCRCSRMVDESLTPTVGNIFVYQGAGTTTTGGAPTDLAFAHCVIKGTLSVKQSFKGATTISSTDAFIITALTFAISRKQATTVDFGVESAKQISAGIGQEKGFAPNFGEITLQSSGLSSLRLNLEPVITIPPNHDVRCVGTSTAANAQGGCTFSGYLATRT